MHASACSDAWSLKITHRTRLRVAARDIITAPAAVLAHEGGYQRALDVIDTIRALHDPRCPDHWPRTRPIS
jgi:hypothetical protein